MFPGHQHAVALIVADRGMMPPVRRLARYTLNALTILSLLLCVATTIMWGWSFSPSKARKAHHGIVLYEDAYHIKVVRRFQIASFGYINWTDHIPFRRLVVIGYGWPSVTFSLLPVFYAFRHICHNKPLAGHCRTCGYDLRASPERCPECGTGVEQGKA